MIVIRVMEIQLKPEKKENLKSLSFIPIMLDEGVDVKWNYVPPR